MRTLAPLAAAAVLFGCALLWSHWRLETVSPRAASHHTDVKMSPEVARLQAEAAALHADLRALDHADAEQINRFKVSRLDARLRARTRWEDLLSCSDGVCDSHLREAMAAMGEQELLALLRAAEAAGKLEKPLRNSIKYLTEVDISADTREELRAVALE